MPKGVFRIIYLFHSTTKFRTLPAIKMTFLIFTLFRSGAIFFDFLANDSASAWMASFGISIISLTGAFAGGLDGILIAVMYTRARQKTKKIKELDYMLSTALIIAFLFGIIYTFSEFF